MNNGGIYENLVRGSSKFGRAQYLSSNQRLIGLAACPKCGAAIGTRCTDGLVSRMSHMARAKAADKLLAK